MCFLTSVREKRTEHVKMKIPQLCMRTKEMQEELEISKVIFLYSEEFNPSF
jgi:hypothetical protein